MFKLLFFDNFLFRNNVYELNMKKISTKLFKYEPGTQINIWFAF